MSGSGFAELDAMIERCKALGASDVGARVAKVAAPKVLAAIQKTAAAGQTPLGKTWKPKVGGGRPLVHAAAHLTARSQGPLVAVTLRGKDVWHHKGSGHVPRRQIMPDGVSVPPAVRQALLEGAREVFRELVK